MNPFVSLTTAGVMTLGVTAAFFTSTNETFRPAATIDSARITPVPANPLAPFTKVEITAGNNPIRVATEPVSNPKELIRSGVRSHSIRRAQWASFENMHAHYTRSFVESEGQGISRVATFNEPYQRRLLVNGTPHRVAGLHLIGLMDHRVVYKAHWVNVLRNQLASYETRELTDVENEAVQYLADGEPYVWQTPRKSESPRQSQSPTQSELITSDNAASEPNTGTLIAGLRATSTCISCHDVEQNELLGAFIYKLQPEPQTVDRGPAVMTQNPVDDESRIADAK